MNRTQTENILCCGLVIAIVVSGLIGIDRARIAGVELDKSRYAVQVAKSSLKNLEDLQVTKYDTIFDAKFKPGDRQNVCVVTWDNKSYTRRDLNKTKIVSEWAGQKTKGAIKGFFSGLLKKEGKHSEDLNSR